MPRKMIQREMVLMFLKDYGTITPLDALREFGIMRLAARVWELKRRGHKITKTMEKSKNRYGQYVKYARYKLDEEQT